MSNCRVCGEKSYPIPSSSSIRTAKKQFIKVKNLHQQFQQKKEELNYEIERKLGDDNYLELCQELYYLMKIQEINERIKKKNYLKEKKILELTEKNIILETKRAQLEEMKQIKQNLQTKLQNNKIINECLLSTHQSDGTNGIQSLILARWRKVFHLFIKFNIECQYPPSSENDSKIKLSGISSILNLPLPNSGNFKDIPADVVSSALSHICHLINSISLILNIPLPHPLLPFDTFESAIIRSHGNLSKHVLLTPSFHPLADITPTPRSQLSHRERVTCRDRNGNISDVLAVLSPIGELDSFYSSDSPVSQLPKRPNRRELEPLHYLFLPKSQQTRDFKPQTSPYPISEGSSIESLNPNGPSTQVFEDQIENSEFQFGLSLLRANILVLCIKSGIDPQKLYPPEALLLNLDLLQQETIKYVSLHDSISTKMENHQYTYASLPPSLERLVDPYPSLNPEQDLLHDDGEYVFSEPEVDIEQLGSLSPILDDSLPSHRFQDHLIASPMRKFEEDMVDGQEWALIEEPEEIENYYH